LYDPRKTLKDPEKKDDWPESTREHFETEFPVPRPCLDEWIDTQVIVKTTETVNRFIYYPFIVIILLGISRLSYFDKWDLPLGLLFVILLTLFYAIYCSVILRRAAQKAREKVLGSLWGKQLDAKGRGEAGKALSEQIEMLINYIGSIRKGAFVPFLEQPWVRAVALSIGGGSGLVALELLPWLT